MRAVSHPAIGGQVEARAGVLERQRMSVWQKADVTKIETGRPAKSAGRYAVSRRCQDQNLASPAPRANSQTENPTGQGEGRPALDNAALRR